jgi:TetR/AcrR family transcriptional regulator
MDNQDKKRELILEAAQKRFAHFGLAKTTMSEIAADLAFSKALLYYYFPDKISLFTAVLEDIIHRYGEEIRPGILAKASAEEAILFQLEKRQEFMKKYYNLLQFTKATGPELPAPLVELFNRTKQAELDLLKLILIKGIERGEIEFSYEPEYVAGIFLDALGGLRINTYVPRLFLPSQEQFEQLLQKEKDLAVIFLSGLRK